MLPVVLLLVAAGGTWLIPLRADLVCWADADSYPIGTPLPTEARGEAPGDATNTVKREAITAENTPPRRSGPGRGALVLMIGTFASRLTGLVRQTLLLQLFPSMDTDAFLVAYRVPNLFRELLAEGALTNSFIPVYRSLPRAEARKLSGALFGVLALVNALLIASALLAAPWIVGVLVGHDSNVNYALAVHLTRIVFPVLAAISLAALAMGILNAEERFFVPAWAPVAFNVVTIAAMSLFPGKITLLTVGVVLGGVAQLAVQLPALWWGGLLPRLGAWWHPGLAGVLLLMAPFAFTTGARQVLNVVATRVLSALPAGSVTAFENANMIFNLALALFSISPALAYYSRLSADAVDNPEHFKHTLLQGLKFISFLTVPAGFLVYLLAEPAVHTLFAIHPAAGQERTLTFTVAAVAPLGLAVFPWGLNNLLVRPFYVRRRIRTPIIINVLAFLANGLLYFLLAPRYGISGMSWGTVLVGWLQLAVLLYWLRKDEGLELERFGRHALRVWLAAALAAWLGYLTVLLPPFSHRWLGAFTQVLLGSGVTAGVYLLLTSAFGLEEVGRLRRLRSPKGE